MVLAPSFQSPYLYYGLIVDGQSHTRTLSGSQLVAHVSGDSQIEQKALSRRHPSVFELDIHPLKTKRKVNLDKPDGLNVDRLGAGSEISVVSEYINSYYHQDTEGTVVNRVFRATHYLPEEVLQLR